MGSVKAYWMDMQEEEAENWIRNQLDDENIEEGSEEWNELSNEYEMLQEHLYEMALLEEDRIWYQQHKHSEFIENFIIEISNLRNILKTMVAPVHEEAHCKMIYVHAVTLLESFLGDTLKSLVISDDKYLTNIVSKVPELKETKKSLEDILAKGDIVVDHVLKWMSTISFHNIPKVIRIYDSALGMTIKTDQRKLGEVIAVRHDIVHRNGRTVEDNIININRALVENAIDVIDDFANVIQTHIQKTK